MGAWYGFAERRDSKADVPKLYTITYKSSLTRKKLYNKTDAIFSIYGKNGINPDF